MWKAGRQGADADVRKTSMPRVYSLSNMCSRSSEKPRSATLPSASHVMPYFATKLRHGVNQ
eukprot:335124-Pleurochrysis_carterae.AAC.1